MSKKENKKRKKPTDSEEDVSKAVSQALIESGVDKSVAELTTKLSGLDLSAYRQLAAEFSQIDLSAYRQLAAELSRALQTSSTLTAPLAATAREGKHATERLNMLSNFQRDCDAFLNSPRLLDMPLRESDEIKQLQQENEQLKRNLQKAKEAMEAKPLEDDRDYQ